MQRSKRALASGMLFAMALSHPLFIPATQHYVPTQLPIILYHHIRPVTSAMTPLARGLSVTPASFEEQLNYFKKNGYTTVPLKTFNDVLKRGTPTQHKAFAITLDDGYEDLYTYAWPLLKKYGFKATAFIIINRVGTPDYATWDQIKEMEASGVVDIESHTLNHSLLTKLPTKKAEFEIVQSKRILESKLGKTISIFCYPYGDFNTTVAKLVEKAGYSLAFTTKGGIWHSYDFRYELSRVRLSTSDVKEVLNRRLKLVFSQRTP